MLCIWWYQKGVVYYELLNLDGTVTTGRYHRQLDNLKRVVIEKRSAIANKCYKVLLHDDNAKSHFANIVQKS